MFAGRYFDALIYTCIDRGGLIRRSKTKVSWMKKLDN